MSTQSKHSKRFPGAELSIRQKRVGEEVRFELSNYLSRGDTALEGIDGVPITVSEVRMSADLKHAFAYVMPLGGQNMEEVVTALNEWKSHIRTEVMRKIHLKFAPQLYFQPDLTYDHMDQVTENLASPSY
ncbi:MAG: ribosome-binding factor A [Alphaproteobacteria bacterium]